MITKKYYKLIRVSHEDEGYFYIKNVSNETGEFKINNYSSGTMEYSLDGVTWTSYDLTNKPGVNVNPNSNIYLRGTNFKYSGNDNVLSFNKIYNICGNFMSVSNYSTMNSVTEINSSNIIKAAFKYQTNLISAGDLYFGNVTTIGEKGLNYFFSGCSSLTTCPNMSFIITVSGYNSMAAFLMDCTSLVIGPDFSSITTVGNNSFETCFYGCTHISNVTTPNVQNLTQNGTLSMWLYNAGGQATGTKVVNVPTGATISSDNSGIPTGWTRVDY